MEDVETTETTTREKITAGGITRLVATTTTRIATAVTAGLKTTAEEAVADALGRRATAADAIRTTPTVGGVQAHTVDPAVRRSSIYLEGMALTFRMWRSCSRPTSTVTLLRGSRALSSPRDSPLITCSSILACPRTRSSSDRQQRVYTL